MRGGGHGDYRCICLAPFSVQEVCDLTYLAFDLADAYRTPVIVLADGIIGQMMEFVRFDHLPTPSPPPKPWALTGTPGRKRNVIKSMRLPPDDLEAFNVKLQGVYTTIQQREIRLEVTGPDDAEVLLAAYGTSARICRQIVERPLQQLPFKVALFRPITLWPFPYQPIREAAARVKFFLVPEMSLGQMIEDVRLGVEGKKPVYHTGRVGGMVSTAREILDELHACAKK